MLQTVPDEPRRFIEDRSQRPGLASSASSRGAAKARPTMAAPVALSRSTSFQNSLASKRCEGRQAIAPPAVRLPKEVNCDGAVHQGRGGDGDGVFRGAGALGGFVEAVDRRDPQHGVAAAAQHLEQVVLPPHHALGHAGGAAGVEDQQVVAGPPPGRPHALGPPADDGLVVLGEGRRRVSGLGHRDPQLHARQPAADRLHGRREGGVEHHRLGVGVVEQVDQFVGDIAVVGVDRHEAGLEGGEVGLEVFRRVVEIGRDLGLPAQPGVQQPPRQGCPNALSKSAQVRRRDPWIWAGRSGTASATVSQMSA